MNSKWVQVGGSFCFLGVALGAFGAHALKEILGDLHTTWETAVHYQFVHALALLMVASMPIAPKALKTIGTLFTAGIVLFSGSLYVLAVTKINLLGAITPFGGVCFLVGWVYLIVAAGRVRPTLAAGPEDEPKWSSYPRPGSEGTAPR